MTKSEKEYTEYLKDVSELRVTMLSLFTGFTFTAITILLNQLPDPSSLISQLTLLFLAVLFDMFLFLLAWQTIIVIGVYKIRNPPAREKWELTVFNLVLFVAFSLWGWSVVLMFLLWDLFYLALVSGFLWALTIVATEAVSRRMRKRLGLSIMEGLFMDTSRSS